MSFIYNSKTGNIKDRGLAELYTEQTVVLNSAKKLAENEKIDNEEEELLKSNSESELSVFQKLCFAFGGLPYQMCGNALGLFIQPFLLEVAGLRPFNISIIIFTGKAWDAITDPLVGYFVNITRTRFGRLRPWILFPAPLACLFYMMIWFVPGFESLEARTGWYLVFYCLFQLFMSCLHVPYTSLTMVLTTSQRVRDSATSFRMGMEVFGVLLAAGIQGIMLAFYDKKGNCPNQTLPVNYTDYYTFRDDKNTTNSNSTGYSKLGEGYLLSAGIMALIYLICCLFTFFGCKEIKDVVVDKNTHFFRSIKKVFKHRSYLSLLFIFLLSSLAIQLVQSNLALFCRYSVDAKNQYQWIIIALLGTTVISLPVWQLIMLKIGKKLTYGIGLSILVPNLIALYFINDTIWVMYLIAVICGLSVSVSFLLPWSMIPDVIDEFMIKTGERKEPIFYSFFVFFTKFASGIAVAISQLVLELVNYKDCPNGCCPEPQPEAVGFSLRLLVVPLPVVMLIISLVLLWFHPINEKRRLEIKEKLIEIRSTNSQLSDKSQSQSEQSDNVNQISI